jgi:hypothetical protein
MNFERKTGGLPKPHPSGFVKPTGLPPVFTGFVNLALESTSGLELTPAIGMLVDVST